MYLISSHTCYPRPVSHGTLLRRGLVAAVTVLLLSSAAGCAADAMHAAPIVLDNLAASIAHALPADHPTYVVCGPRVATVDPAPAGAAEAGTAHFGLACTYEHAQHEPHP